MQIKVINACDHFSLLAGEEVDTDNSPITELEAWWMCVKGYATTDMNADDVRGMNHVPGKVYKMKANIVKNNNIYQLKDSVIESTPAFLEAEWDLIVQGVV